MMPRGRAFEVGSKSVSALKVLSKEKPAPKASALRASRSGKRRAWVLLGVHVLIGLHITHWLVAGHTVTPVEPSEAMAFTKANIVNAGALFFAAMIVLTAIFGRFFCGWGCHVVALQDLCRHWLEKAGIKPRPLRSRLLAWVPALAFFYMFLWPWVYRLWVGDSFRGLGFELTTSEFWATFPGWIIGTLTFLICGFAIVYFLGAKGFCTYGCPYGAIFGAVDKVAPMRIRVTDACQQCGHCTAVCTSNVQVAQEVKDWGMVVDSGCMKCLDCVSVCPTNALYYGSGPIPWLTKPRVEKPTVRRAALPWGEEILLAGAFVAAFLSFRGLYGYVPFLMSLGVAGIVAYFVLVAVRLARRTDVSVQGRVLKRTGELTRAGRGAVATGLLFTLFWAHSAAHRTLLYRADRAWGQIAARAPAILDVTAPPPQLQGAAREAVVTAVGRLETVRRWGLFPTLGNASRLAQATWLAGDETAAVGHALRAAARDEDLVTMRQLLGRKAWQSGNLAQAVAEYELAIAARPELAEPYVNLGILYVQVENLSSALDAFERGLAHVPQSPKLLYNAGLARALKGDSAAAIPLFQQALSRAPGDLRIRENLAGVLASVGRFEESAALYREALAQAPEDASTRLLLARVLVEWGRKDEARVELERVLLAVPDSDEAREALAQLAAP
jgi:polyferredoxin/Flp pilus assembly protein TadD